MDSHLGRALWRFSVDALTRLLTYGEGTRLPPPAQQQPRLQRRRSPRSPDAFGVRRSRRAPSPAPVPSPTSAPTPTSPPATQIRRRSRRPSTNTSANPEILPMHPSRPAVAAPAPAPETSHPSTRKERQRQKKRKSVRNPPLPPVRVRRELYAPREVRFDPRPVIMST